MEVLRLKNRLVIMKSDRWPKKVWNWDRSTKTDAWSNEVALVLSHIRQDPALGMDLMLDLDEVDKISVDKAIRSWTLESYSKTKLRTFIQIHDFDDPRVLICANLSRTRWSLVSKFKAGVLPVKLETGWFKGIGIEKRICDLCKSRVEDKLDFTFGCDAMEDARKQYFEPLSKKIKRGWKLSNIEVLEEMVSETHIKEFADCFEQVYEHRKRLLYK